MTSAMSSSETTTDRAAAPWRVACLGLVAVMAIVGASCSSNGATTPGTAQTTTTTTAVASATTVAGAPSVGTAATATGPGRQELQVTAGKPTHTGALIGGPAGSWLLGFILTNSGPAPFDSVPASQITIVDSAGKTHAPIAGNLPTTGKPTTLAVGQQVRMLLLFELAPGATPVTIGFAPFGSSVAPIHWNN